MLEQQRIEYLQAMGIQLWMPRKPVANAAQSLWFADDELSNSLESNSNTAHVKVGNAADLLAGIGSIDSNTSTSAARNSLDQLVASQDASHSPPLVTNRSTEQSASQALSTSNSIGALENKSREILDSDISTSQETPLVDLTPPQFQLFFALWPCGVLWVASTPFDQRDQSFQASVSYFLLRTTVPHPSYSDFKWPYIEGSQEDQSTDVALRALTAQWDFMSSQGARVWVACDNSGSSWLSKVAASSVCSYDKKESLFSMEGKKLLWKELQSLPSMTVA